jgi:uncharacterized protein DUF4268
MRSDRQQLQLDYWTKFVELAQERGCPAPMPTPKGQNWVEFHTDRSNLHINVYTDMKRDVIGVALMMYDPDAKVRFDLLQQQRDTLDREMAVSMKWCRRPENRYSSVELEHRSDPEDRGKWTEQHEWLYENLIRMLRVLVPRVKQLSF